MRLGVSSAWVAAVAGPLLLALAVVGILAIALVAFGFDVTTSLHALGRGAVGSPRTFASSTLVRATPLILTGLAVAIAFRAGIWNIGADGQLLGGAAAATAMGLATGSSLGFLGIPLLLLAGAGGGALCAAGPAWLRRRFGVLEVISTIMVNFIVLFAVGYLVRGPLQEATHVYPQSASLAPVLRLPFVLPGTRLHLGFLLAIGLAMGASWFFRATAGGFRVRVIGANAHAAAVTGRVDVAGLTSRVFLTSGAVAGLAGAVEVSGVTQALYENLSPGYGFTAIAVALLGGLEPIGVVASGIFLGGLAAGAAAMQREAGVPAVLVSVLEAVIILSVIGARAWMARRPRTAIT